MAGASDLLEQTCRPCEGGEPPLTAQQIQQLMPKIPQWHWEDNSIRRTWRADDFQTAMQFLQRVGDLAEQEGHHPDLHLTGYRNIAIELSTHAIGGLSDNDFILAAKIDALPGPES